MCLYTAFENFLNVVFGDYMYVCGKRNTVLCFVLFHELICMYDLGTAKTVKYAVSYFHVDSKLKIPVLPVATIYS